MKCVPFFMMMPSNWQQLPGCFLCRQYHDWLVMSALGADTEMNGTPSLLRNKTQTSCLAQIRPSAIKPLLTFPASSCIILHMLWIPDTSACSFQNIPWISHPFTPLCFWAYCSFNLEDFPTFLFLPHQSSSSLSSGIAQSLVPQWSLPWPPLS